MHRRVRNIYASGNRLTACGADLEPLRSGATGPSVSASTRTVGTAGRVAPGTAIGESLPFPASPCPLVGPIPCTDLQHGEARARVVPLQPQCPLISALTREGDNPVLFSCSSDIVSPNEAEFHSIRLALHLTDRVLCRHSVHVLPSFAKHVELKTR